ncbi:Ser/Thr protein kinase RdoA involved in Cpx stress response, MazF antagonist [Kosakonia arachidis]|uniref:Ser/Thr protein kinase RdoA involved in Cpx stress response, MazF antagonist n=1 Tax=Kosakonia arachidis TaxID=551989 RepID=A0A1I7DV39_9ENTR|nr:phosphotransferase [Kosakonia arachidis]SFU15525.1 Ser/Thr protein kinase RdoA involved in Cpx stress response, MazF antagonist [Kosakonia arachidis]
MLYHDSYIERISGLLRAALPLWGLSEKSELALLTFSENATFLATEADVRRRLVLRVHRPNYCQHAEIISELDWLNSLKTSRVINVAAPIPQLNGERIARLEDETSVTFVVAFEFVAGAEPDNTRDLSSWYRRLGEIAARLHLHSLDWQRPPAFTRKIWTFETIIGKRALWGDWRSLSHFTPEEITLLEQTERQLKAQLDDYGCAPDRFGLVHCDMRLANLLVEGEQMTVIDFDDCGICWFGWDFATAVSFIEDDPLLGNYQAAWLEGYQSVRPLSTQDKSILPALVMLRRLQLSAWIASHAETPTAQRLVASFPAGTVMLARQYLHEHAVNMAPDAQQENLQ